MTKLTSAFRDQGSAAVGLVIIFIIMSVASSNFLTLDNLINVGRQISINAILAVGMTFVIITGGIDLSVGAVIALVGTFWATTVVNYNAPIWVGMILALAIGTILGVIKVQLFQHKTTSIHCNFSHVNDNKWGKLCIYRRKTYISKYRCI